MITDLRSCMMYLSMYFLPICFANPPLSCKFRNTNMIRVNAVFFLMVVQMQITSFNETGATPDLYPGH